MTHPLVRLFLSSDNGSWVVGIEWRAYNCCKDVDGAVDRQDESDCEKFEVENIRYRMPQDSGCLALR